jgi:hypothetical protein
MDKKYVEGTTYFLPSIVLDGRLLSLRRISFKTSNSVIFVDNL